MAMVFQVCVVPSACWGITVLTVVDRRRIHAILEKIPTTNGPGFVVFSVHKCSQKTLKIVNRSEIPVKFAWEAFATSSEEEVGSLGQV